MESSDRFYLVLQQQDNTTAQRLYSCSSSRRGGNKCTLWGGKSADQNRPSVCRPLSKTADLAAQRTGRLAACCPVSKRPLTHSFQTLNCSWASSTESRVVKMLYHRLREEAAAVLHLGALQKIWEENRSICLWFSLRYKMLQNRYV